MKTMNIFLICPRCGCIDWIPREDEEAEGAFECANCHELEFPENMDARSSDDLP